MHASKQSWSEVLTQERTMTANNEEFTILYFITYISRIFVGSNYLSNAKVMIKYHNGPLRKM